MLWKIAEKIVYMQLQNRDGIIVMNYIVSIAPFF